MIELKEMTCPICRKKYKGFDLACSKQCHCALIQFVALIGICGEVMRMVKNDKNN